jgi:hypothetical protein
MVRVVPIECEASQSSQSSQSPQFFLLTWLWIFRRNLSFPTRVKSTYPAERRTKARYIWGHRQENFQRSIVVPEGQEGGQNKGQTVDSTGRRTVPRSRLPCIAADRIKITVEQLLILFQKRFDLENDLSGKQTCDVGVCLTCLLVVLLTS